MGKYDVECSAFDNAVYKDTSPIPKKTGAYEDSFRTGSSGSSQTSKKTLWLSVLATFVLTSVVAIAITYPVTKNAYETRCDDIKSTPEMTWPAEMPTSSKPTPSPSSSSEAISTTMEMINKGTFRSEMVDTFYGPVQGHVVDMGTGNPMENVLSFKGIPYSKPPERWEMPTEPEPWTETLIADEFGNTCPHGDGNFNESCLFLNIYTPIMDVGWKYPVMLWIHGGSYQSGSSNGYPGHVLASRGVVVVTINYRLSIFGFASGGNGTLKGNYGLWDQRQAMLFVNKTISAFGGDPNRVTVFGQSAGASSIGLHLISPHSEGLFHQAILESGNEMTMWAMNTPIDEPDTYITQVSSELGCLNETTTDMEMVDCLKMVDADTLAKAPFKCPFCLGFAPVVDWDFIPNLPTDMLKNGDFNNVDIMLGTNMNECNMFMLEDFPRLLFMGISREQFETGLVDIINYFYYVVTASSGNSTVVQDLYEAMDFMYTPWPDAFNETLLRRQMGQVCTDFSFAAPTNQVARLHSNKVKVHLYAYDVKRSGLEPFPDWIGIYHGYELSYVFGHPQISNGTMELKEDVDIAMLRCWTPEDIAWSEYIITLWTNYAKFGEPTPEPVAPPDMEASSWEPFDNRTFSYYLINNEVVGNWMGYRLQETAFIYEYLWWIARDEHFDMVHSLPEKDVVLNEDKFEHLSMKDLSLMSMLEHRIEMFNMTDENMTMPWDKFSMNCSTGDVICDKKVTWWDMFFMNCSMNRMMNGSMEWWGVDTPNYTEKPIKDMPDPCGMEFLQKFYDNLTDVEYIDIQTALISINKKYADQMRTVHDFLVVIMKHPVIMNMLQELIQHINWVNLMEFMQEATIPCDSNLLEYANTQFSDIIALLEMLGVMSGNMMK